MKFNGIDPTSLHPAISIAEEKIACVSPEGRPRRTMVFTYKARGRKYFFPKSK